MPYEFQRVDVGEKIFPVYSLRFYTSGLQMKLPKDRFPTEKTDFYSRKNVT